MRRAVLAAATLLASVTARADDPPGGWEAFLAARDLRWEALPSDWWSGAFTGNGGLGAMIWRDGDGLRVDLGHTEVWDHQADGGLGSGRAGRTRLIPSRLTLRTACAVRGGAMRMDLWNAEVTARVETACGALTLRTFTHATRDVMVFSLRAEGGETAARWEPTARPAMAFWGQEPRANPPPVLRRDDDLAVIDQDLVAGGGYRTAWREVTDGDGARALYLSMAYGTDGAAHRGAAAARVREAAAMGVEALTATHRGWWHGYWPRSWISLPDRGLERFYAVQMYKLASATRADRPVYDLLGPWPREARWAGLWWNLNVQMTYWPVYTSGRLELGASLLRALHRADIDGTLGANEPVPALRGTSGALAPTSDPTLRSASQHVEHCDLPWAVHNAWLQYRYTMDDAALRAQVVPLLRRAANYYLARRADAPVPGRFNIPAARSPEYDREGPNPSVDVALLAWLLDALREADDRFGLRDADRPRWDEARRALVDLPSDETGVLIATGVRQEHSHREPAHLLAIAPLHTLAWDDPSQRERIRASVLRWTRDPRVGLLAPGADRSGYSFTWASQLYAAMGDGDGALDMLQRTFTDLDVTMGIEVTPNTFYRDQGWPTGETPMGVAAALHDMLLQSHGGVVRVLPAVPSSWRDVSFDGLRAEGAFAVGATRRGGVTEEVVVESLAGEPLTLRTDLPRPWRVEGARAYDLRAVGATDVRIDLRRGERVRLRAATEPVDATPIAPAAEAPGGCNARPYGTPRWPLALLAACCALRPRRRSRGRVKTST